VGLGKPVLSAEDASAVVANERQRFLLSAILAFQAFSKPLVSAIYGLCDYITANFTAYSLTPAVCTQARPMVLPE
jgi:hypothetical protein